jgi:hypothetical protein
VLRNIFGPEGEGRENCVMSNFVTCSPHQKIGKINVKVNFTLEEATKVERGSRGIILLFFNLVLDGVGDQSHAPAALLPGKIR